MLRYTYIACLVSKYFSHYDRGTVGLFLEQYAKLRLDTSVTIALTPAEHHRGSIHGSFYIYIRSVRFWSPFINTIRSFARDKGVGRLSLPRRDISAEVRNA